MSGWRMVKPLTCTSYSTVSAYRYQGRLPSCQLNAGSTIRLLGTCPAESRVLGLPGSAASWPSTSGPKVTVPATALA